MSKEDDERKGNETNRYSFQWMHIPTAGLVLLKRFRLDTFFLLMSDSRAALSHPLIYTHINTHPHASIHVYSKLKHFMKYLDNNRDDSPLYIFDSGFDEDRVGKKILDDYRVPSFFRDDLFRLVSEQRRPPYRWFLIGPERSGTCVHIDPLATSAWNTLIRGKKRWVLFPPNVPKHIAKGRGYVRKGEDDEAIHYFMYILPRIKRHAEQVGNRGEFSGFACYEFTQNEGETVFIPNGWWHAVLNLTHTVGVTQNFCSPRNFDRVWRKTRSGRKLMAAKWLCQLDVHYPELGRRARELNHRDHFVMKYDPEEVRRNDERKKELRRQRGNASSRQSRSTVTESTARPMQEQQQGYQQQGYQQHERAYPPQKRISKPREDVSPSSVMDVGMVGSDAHAKMRSRNAAYYNQHY